MVSAAEEADGVLPQELLIQFIKPVFYHVQIELKGGTLVYNESEPLTIGAREWKRFRSELDRIGVWKWKGEYNPSQPNTHDSTWRVMIRYADRSVEAEGTAYPQADGSVAGDGRMTSGFQKFSRALYQLTGKRF